MQPIATSRAIPQARQRVVTTADIEAFRVGLKELAHSDVVRDLVSAMNNYPFWEWFGSGEHKGPYLIGREWTSRYDAVAAILGEGFQKFAVGTNGLYIQRLSLDFQGRTSEECVNPVGNLPFLHGRMDDDNLRRALEAGNDLSTLAQSVRRIYDRHPCGKD